MMTLTSCGGLIPIEMASRRMEGSAVARLVQLSYAGLTRVSIALSEVAFKMMDCRVKPGNDERPSGSPGEPDLVERFGPELLRGARHHAAAERAIEFRRWI